MNVIRVVLRIVVLDQAPRTVQPEVVRVTRLEETGPGEGVRPDARLADAGPLRLGQIGPEVPDEFLDQALGQRTLRWGHVADRQPDGGPEGVGTTRAAHDVAKRPRGDDRPVPVGRRETPDQLAGEVFLRAEDAEASERAGRHPSRVRPHEGGRDGPGRTVGEREVEREVVPFDSPAPERSGLRVAEYDPRIVVR